MKKIKYLLFIVFVGIIGLNYCYAASLSVSSSKKTVVVGSTVTVTVNASGAAGWEYCINYDSSVLSLSSSTVGNNGSLSCLQTGSTLTGGSSVKFVFKAKKSGSTTVSLKNANMYNDTGNEISFSKGSVSITAKTQAEIEANYSTNAYLSNLRVVDYEITPEFKKDVYEYDLEVENNVESITIKATKDDSSASVSGTGEKELTEGMNVFKIVVTAEKGNTKTYVINVNRKELNPIDVTIDDKHYTVVRKEDALQIPTYYTTTTIKINDEDIPAFVSEITGYTLVGLKDDDGNIALYSYNDGEYKIYRQFGTEGFVFIVEDTDKVVEGYEKTKNIKINDNDVEVYVGEDNSEFVLLYGMNATTGDRGWYKYDTKEGTFQRYVELEDNNNSKDSKLYFYLMIVFASLSGLTILLVILLMILNSKIRKKNNKLIEMIKGSKNNKEVQEVKIEEDNSEEKEEENEEDSSLEENKEELSAEETIINNIAKANEESFDDTTTDLEESIHDTEILKEIKERENVEEPKLSKREMRRLEKEKAAKELAELKKMQEDFLKTNEYEVVNDDKETENKKSKKRKKNK